MTRLPAFLQIGIVVTALSTLAGAIWFAVDPGSDSLYVIVTVTWALPLAWGWAWVYRRRLVNYRAVPARISALSRAEEAMMFATSVHYYYTIEDRVYAGTHVVANARHLSVGTKIWVLVSPTNPKRSVGWL